VEPRIPARRTGTVGFAPPDFLLRLVAVVGRQEWGTRMAHRRSARFARDDKKGEGHSKERAVAEPRHLSKPIWTGLKFSRPYGTESGNAYSSRPCGT
jgi:hypothetical protein